MTTSSVFSFYVATPEEDALIRQWLKQGHIKEYLYGQGLQNTLDDLNKACRGEESQFTHWIGRINGQPFSYLMTSFIEKNPQDELAKWIVDDQAIISLDLFIGEKDFIGKGLAVPMIHAFLRSHFSDVGWVIIDPALSNSRAIHVYEKAGFERLETFIPSWAPGEHLLMRLNINLKLRVSRSH